MADRAVIGGPFLNETSTADRALFGGPFVNITVSGGGVAGTLSATESAQDAFSGSGLVKVQGALAAPETGDDVFSAGGSGPIFGTLSASEVSQDTFAANGTSGSVISIAHGGGGGAGGGARVARSKAFNTLLERVFSKKPLRQKQIAALVERAAPTPERIAEVQSALHDGRKVTQQIVAAKLKVTIEQLAIRKQELEEEEATVVGLLLL